MRHLTASFLYFEGKEEIVREIVLRIQAPNRVQPNPNHRNRKDNPSSNAPPLTYFLAQALDGIALCLVSTSSYPSL
jgi:hypothetical protein